MASIPERSVIVRVVPTEYGSSTARVEVEALGEIEIRDYRSFPLPKPGFRMEVCFEGASAAEAPAVEVERALRKVIEDLPEIEGSGRSTRTVVRDINGNEIGHWTFMSPPKEVR